MPASALPNLGLQHGWILGEEPWGDEMNANLRRIDAMVQSNVIDKDLNTPPGSPANGDTYIVGPAPTGSWASMAGRIARWAGAAWEFYTPKTGWFVWVVDEAAPYRYISGAWKQANVTVIPLAVSDEETPLAVGVVTTFVWPKNLAISKVSASLTTAQATNGAGGIFTMDFKVNGSSIFSTLLTIDNTEKTTNTAATAAVIAGTIFSYTAFSEVQVEITQIGDGTAVGLKLYIEAAQVL